MKLVLGIVAGLVLIACGSPTPGRSTTAEIANVDPSSSASIRIAWEGSAVGQRWTKVEDRSLTAVVVPTTGQAMEVVTAEHGEEIHEVLAAEGGALTKLKVRYAKHRRTETVQGNAREKPTPTLGKIYLVWREDGELKASLEDGSAPSAEELEAVIKGNHSVGKPDAMGQFIASRAWKIGEKVALDPSQLAALVESWSTDGAELTAMSLTLRAADDATATFAMAMEMAGPMGEGGEMTLAIAGTAVVARGTGRLRSFEMVGPLAGVVGAGQVKVSGTMANKAVYTY